RDEPDGPGEHRPSRWGHCDLPALIRERGIELQPRGDDRLVGGHGAKHPSKSGLCLVVWAAEGRYWCSSCRESGDAVSWLMNWEGWSYAQAADELRKRFGPPEDERRDAKRLKGTSY